MFFLYKNKNQLMAEATKKLCENTYKKISKLTYGDYQNNTPDRYTDGFMYLITSATCYAQSHVTSNTLTLIHGDTWQRNTPVSAKSAVKHFNDFDKYSNSIKLDWRGNFIILHYDKIKKSLKLVSDPLGLHPCFYYTNSECEIFCSQPELIVDFCKERLSVNWDAIREYLFFGASFPGSSLLKEIVKVPASTILSSTDKKLSSIKYSNSIRTCVFDGPLREAAGTVCNRLTTSVDNLISYYDVKTSYLTGGSDSRVLLSLMNPEVRKKLKYICYSNTDWSAGNEDSEIATLLADFWKLDLDVIPEPLSKNRICTPDIFKASKFNMVLEPTLTGSYGTETVGGAPFTHFGCEFTKLEFRQFLKSCTQLVGAQEHHAITLTYEKFHDLILSESGGSKEFNFLIKWLWQSQLTSIYSGYNSGAFIYSYKNMIKQKISPFMDDNYLEFMMGLPREYLMKYALYREIFSTQLFAETKIAFNSNMHRYVPNLPKLRPKESVGSRSSFLHKKYVLDTLKDSFFADSPFDVEIIVDRIKHNCNWEHIVRFCDLIVWHETFFNPEKISIDNFNGYTSTE